MFDVAMTERALEWAYTRARQYHAELQQPNLSGEERVALSKKYVSTCLIDYTAETGERAPEGIASIVAFGPSFIDSNERRAQMLAVLATRPESERAWVERRASDAFRVSNSGDVFDQAAQDFISASPDAYRSETGAVPWDGLRWDVNLLYRDLCIEKLAKKPQQ